MRAYELIESSSYIPQNEYEAHDPRWEMALSCDIHPGEDIRQAAKFKFKLGKGGIPPLLRVDGKITESKDKDVYKRQNENFLDTMDFLMVLMIVKNAIMIVN